MLIRWDFVGAGSHKTGYHKRYNKLAKVATKAGIDSLKNGGGALDAIKAAVMGRCLSLK